MPRRYKCLRNDSHCSFTLCFLTKGCELLKHPCGPLYLPKMATTMSPISHVLMMWLLRLLPPRSYIFIPSLESRCSVTSEARLKWRCSFHLAFLGHSSLEPSHHAVRKPKLAHAETTRRSSCWQPTWQPSSTTRYEWKCLQWFWAPSHQVIPNLLVVPVETRELWSWAKPPSPVLYSGPQYPWT